MEHRVDIVGHFGSRYSYATVASRVARGLRDAGLLGTCFNVDEEWHADYADLNSSNHEIHSHVILFTAPYRYYEIYAERYGRDRAALYGSPNTDSLSDEHREAFERFGCVFVPSTWCADVIRGAVPGARVEAVPLGVDDWYVSMRGNPLPIDEYPTFLHLSTDHSWPGRKGTEELIEAWYMAKRAGMLPGRLIVHVPRPIHGAAEMLRRDMAKQYQVVEKQSDTITVQSTPKRGSSEDELLSLYRSAHIVVIPSRCEGFGMMMLGSLVAGVPLVAPYATGQVDFLREMPGWLGVPVWDADKLAFEEGTAPIIDPKLLANTLSVAALDDTYSTLVEQLVRFHRSDEALDGGLQMGTWSWAKAKWVERVEEWVKETTS